jgi:DNA polymerase
VRLEPTLEGFRAAARPLLAARVPPDTLFWSPHGAGQGSLFDHNPAPTPAAAVAPVALPARFVALAADVVLHRDPARFALLYRLAFRLLVEGAGLIEDAADPDVLAAERKAAQVRRDVHKVHAFVRFRRVVDPDGRERFVAFHRPDHHVLPAAVDLFVERFASLRWSILTPDASAHWEDGRLTFGAGAPAATVAADELEALWRTYYAAVYNPARLNLKAMTRELPRRHFATLPELAVLPDLISASRPRVEAMLSDALATPDRPVIPTGASLPVLAAAAQACAACPHAAAATGTVFGEGDEGAALALVGEQPGDEEDRCGRPFVGPAGRLLDRALAGAGIARGNLYLTNAVKHFKFEPRGKRRLHAKPGAREVVVCRPWLEAELGRVRPRVVLALGATAAQALFGGRPSPRRDRGAALPTPFAPVGFVTYHPSAILRASGTVAEALEAALVEDLRRAAAAARAA